MKSEKEVQSPTRQVSPTFSNGGSASRSPWESMMEYESIGEIIATRRLYYLDEDLRKRTVSVFIGKPQPSVNPPGYHCPFQVIGAGNQMTQVAKGRDSIEALQSAMVLIGANLNQLDDELNRHLTWECGESGELGFP